MQNIKFDKKLWKLIWCESFRGKGIARILMNQALTDFKLKGQIIDLGSGSGSPSYYRFLQFQKDYQLIKTDYYETGPSIIKLDLEKKLKNLADNSYDYVLCLNVLEHIYNYNDLIKEINRILKVGGSVIMSTPFLTNYHPAPHDYWRFTNEAIDKLFSPNKWHKVSMINLGLGPLLASYRQKEMIVPFFLKPFCLTLIIGLDKIFLKIKNKYLGRYPLSYLYIYKKY